MVQLSGTEVCHCDAVVSASKIAVVKKNKSTAMMDMDMAARWKKPGGAIDRDGSPLF